ncbi:MAG: recombinase family protein, partial [Eubacterium sp.]|nr:recombinase family protein [Eubacterium sp.]
MARIRKNTVKKEIEEKWIIAGYCRLSKEDEREDESESIENQRGILTDYVQSYFEGQNYVVKYYEDDGYSGTNLNRPGFQELQNDIEMGRINCVVVKSLSRGWRNLGDQQTWLTVELPKKGIRFISKSNPVYDSLFENHRYNMELPMYGLSNEMHAGVTSAHVRETFDYKRKHGLHMGSFAIFGYNKVNKNYLVVDEEAAAIIQDIFTWFLYGKDQDSVNGSMSMTGIAAELNERGIPCPMAYKQLKGQNYKNPHAKHKKLLWSQPTIRRILTERMYIGDMVQGRYETVSYLVKTQTKKPEEEWDVVEGTHEPIISKDMFYDVQAKLLRDQRSAPGKKTVYLFSGKVHCATCGRSMSRKARDKYVYYACRTPSLSKGDCTARSISIELLEEAVLKSIQSQIALVKDIAQVIEKINKAPRINFESNRLKAQLKILNEQNEEEHLIYDSLY